MKKKPKKPLPTARAPRHPIPQREVDDTAHAALMERARQSSDHKEQKDLPKMEKPPGCVDVGDFAAAASYLANDALERFRKSEKAGDNGNKVTLWGEARVLCELANAHAQAALALKAAAG